MLVLVILFIINAIKFGFPNHLIRIILITLTNDIMDPEFFPAKIHSLNQDLKSVKNREFENRKPITTFSIGMLEVVIGYR
jgi:hypothetical protein